MGALSATLLTLVLAGVARTGELVLAGVVVGSVLTGLTTYLMMQDADRVRAVFAYTLGNLAFAGWEGVRLLALFFALAFPPPLPGPGAERPGARGGDGEKPGASPRVP